MLVVHSYPFIYEDLILREDLFILIVGSTGTGKTNDALYMIDVLSRNGYPVLVIDPKGEYKKRFSSEDMAVYHFDYGENMFLWNPLQPPSGVKPSVWVRAFSDVFTRVYGLSDPSRRILHQILEKLYAKYGVYENSGFYPTLRELERAVSRFKPGSRSEADSKRALENRLYLVNYGNVGDALNVPQSIDLSYLYEDVNILDLSAVSSVRDQQLIVELLIGAILEHRKVNPWSKALNIIIEEAHRFVPEVKERFISERNLIELAVAEGRSYGLRFIVLDQTPSLLSRQVMANCGIKIIHRLDSYEDIKLIIKIVGVLEDDLASIENIARMDTGKAVITHPKASSNTILRFDMLKTPIEMPKYMRKRKLIIKRKVRRKHVVRKELRIILSLYSEPANEIAL